MASELVAAGDGAFTTWSVRPSVDTEKSSTIEAKEPAAEPATAREPSRPLGDLLPTGTDRVAVALLGAALFAASFAVYGLGGRALVGAVFCPVLVLLAAIDYRYHLLPNAIVLTRP